MTKHTILKVMKPKFKFGDICIIAQRGKSNQSKRHYGCLGVISFVLRHEVDYLEAYSYSLLQLDKTEFTHPYGVWESELKRVPKGKESLYKVYYNL